MILRRPSFLLRVLAVALALLQAATPALAAVGDGLLALRGGPRALAAHVEDRSQAGCPAVHAADCAVCAFLTVAAEHRSEPLPYVRPAARPIRAPEPPTAPAAPSRGPPTARGPPGC